MTNDVRDSYDAMAVQYAGLFLRDLDRDASGREWLAMFTKLAAHQHGTVADLGCGPGHVVDHLSELGLRAVGYDISSGQIAEARKAFPDREFHVADFAALDNADASLGGIVARYSLIHMPPARHSEIFEEWMRVLQPGAPLLLSFFASSSGETHGAPFDHRVVTAYELFPITVARQLQDIGFADVEFGVCDPPAGARPLDQGTVLARKPNT